MYNKAVEQINSTAEGEVIDMAKMLDNQFKQAEERHLHSNDQKALQEAVPGQNDDWEDQISERDRNERLRRLRCMDPNSFKRLLMPLQRLLNEEELIEYKKLHKVILKQLKVQRRFHRVPRNYEAFLHFSHLHA